MVGYYAVDINRVVAVLVFTMNSKGIGDETWKQRDREKGSDEVRIWVIVVGL